MRFLLERYPKQLLEKVAQNIFYLWKILFGFTLLTFQTPFSSYNVCAYLLPSFETHLNIDFFK